MLNTTSKWLVGSPGSKLGVPSLPCAAEKGLLPTLSIPLRDGLNGTLNEQPTLVTALGRTSNLLARPQQIELFWDENGGGFFFTSNDHESLIARGKQITDGALPAGNSVAAQNLLYLAEATENDEYRQYARKTALSVVPLLQRSLRAAPRMVLAIDQLENDMTNGE